MKTATKKKDLFPTLRSVRALLIMAIVLAVPFTMLLLGSQTNTRQDAEMVASGMPIVYRTPGSITPPPGCVLSPRVCNRMCPTTNPNCCQNLPPILVCPSGSPSPQVTCIPRPPCLDSMPRCMIAEPIDGWCPPKISPSLSPTLPAGCRYNVVCDPRWTDQNTGCRPYRQLVCLTPPVAPSVTHPPRPVSAVIFSLWKYLTGSR